MPSAELADGYATFVDPLAKNQEQMNARMVEWNLWKKGEWYNEPEKREEKTWWRK